MTSLTVVLIRISAVSPFDTLIEWLESYTLLRTAAVPNHQAPSYFNMESLDPSLTMSFPAVLRNPGLINRYAHLLVAADTAKGRSRKAGGSYVREKEGKRRIRRRENGAVHRSVHKLTEALSWRRYSQVHVQPSYCCAVTERLYRHTGSSQEHVRRTVARVPSQR